VVVGLDLIAHGIEQEIDALRGSFVARSAPGSTPASPGDAVA
jgi:hypothetical protein